MSSDGQGQVKWTKKPYTVLSVFGLEVTLFMFRQKALAYIQMHIIFVINKTAQGRYQSFYPQSWSLTLAFSVRVNDLNVRSFSELAIAANKAVLKIYRMILICANYYYDWRNWGKRDRVSPCVVTTVIDQVTT